MPIYEFECAQGHRFSKIMSIDKMESIRKSGIPCEWLEIHAIGHAHIVGEEFGNGMAYLQWSIPAKIQIGKPTIVFINPQTGEARVAVHQHEQPPAGYIKEELKSSIDRSRFENIQNAIAKEQDEIYNEANKIGAELGRKERHDQLNAEMSKVCSETDNPSATESLMRAAMKRKRKPAKKRKTEFRLDVNHLDKSNL